MKNTRAIVTLIVGAKFQEFWQRDCRANWEAYAARHDADLIVLAEPLDTSPRATTRRITWQKLLILGEPRIKKYSQVVWLDADILIHPHAPWVGQDVPPHLVGAADEYAYPTKALNRIALARLYNFWRKHNIRFADNPTPREFYELAGFPVVADRAVQAGVMVVTPHLHRDVFEYVYHHYEQLKLGGLNGEMRSLSYELIRANLVHWLAPQWNGNWLMHKALFYPFLFLETRHPLLARCATQTLAQNYFLHFAGSAYELDAVNLHAPRLQPPPQIPAYESPQQTSYACQSSVAVCLFNRPETTARVMQAVRAARPRELYLIADGARADQPADAAQCDAARRVALQVDWDCAVKTNFAETNMGLKARIESGLDWLFQHVPEAIVLEDDCVPDATFFRFCDEMLERYRHDARVMMISACDYKFGLSENPASYSFSRYPLIWGWATWRRAWQQHDPNMTTLPDALANGRLQNILQDTRAAQYWAFLLNDNFHTRATWDYAWVWSIWERDGLCIHPNTNLVENIGFTENATHTRNTDDFFADLLKNALAFPLRHPESIARDNDNDALIEEIAFSGAVRRVWERVAAHRRARQANAPRAAQ